ncbi:MAG: hypothetical protein H7Z40_13795 [Phycisphaerae bacterium]|nr:hypothetical protein [Gemmatimonadaceae bacterium]
MRPPRFAEATLRAVLAENDDLSEAMLGDMAEGWSTQASTLGARSADRWYWEQTMRSLPSLLAFWCRTVGLRRLTAIAAIAAVARVFMLVLQYAALTIGGAAMSGRSSVATALAIVPWCLGAATLTGYVVRRIGARDAAVRVGVLCTVVLVFHVVSPRLIHSAMPTWLYWITTAPLSAIAVIVGAAYGRRRIA